MDLRSGPGYDRYMINRRDAIKTIGGLAGMASLSKLLSGCSGDNGGPSGITTYVFVMLENRSYDHYLGARKLIGLPGDGLTAAMRNNDVNGIPIAPYEPAKDKMCDPDPPHGWDELRISWNNGACDGFVKAHQMAHSSTTLTDPMQYMTRTQLPISWALADAYTSCDRWFCSLMGPTLPNRAYWHTGTSLGIGKEPDASGAT
jgi:phospholipase C